MKHYHMPFATGLAKFFLLLFILAIFFSCKRNTDFNESASKEEMRFVKKTGGSIPVFSTAQELNEHLRWIARGLATWQKPETLVMGIDSILNHTSNDSNDNPILYLNSIFAFDSTLKDSINTRFPSNNFDADGLHSFSVNNRTYFTTIYAANNFYTQSKPFVVVAAETPTDSNHTNGALGYYATGNGGIDSLTINDQNEDNYYIWVVDYYHPSEYDDEFEASGGDGIQRKSGRVLKCDNDAVCEGGEKYNPNCTDCYPAPPQKYKVILTELEIFRDNCPRASRFFDGKYEFNMSYGLYDNLGTSPSNKGTIDDYYHNISIKRVNRRDICRERCVWGGSRGSNCPSWIINVDYTMYEEIEPSDSNCKMPFIFYEYDFDPFKVNADLYYGYWELASGRGYQQDGYDIPYWWSWQAPYTTQTISLYDMWQANNHNGSSIWVGNSEARVKIKLIKL